MDLVLKSGTSIASSLAKSFATNVIERWTKRRAEKFFEEFQAKIVESRLLGDNQIEIAKEIDAIISTEIGSEVVFDAYRSVSLAKSKVIGPRIIGALTAEICLENRFSDEFDELFFSVAESLSDFEIINVSSVIESWFELSRSDKKKHYLTGTAYIERNELIYILEHQESNAAFGSSNEIDLNIGNLDFEFCSGLEKFKSLGLLIPRVIQSSYNIEYDGTIQVTKKALVFPLIYRRIISLISEMSDGVEF
ncbi:hypothetical protein P0F15_003133 [Vibrio metschnikovii]|uniref:DUF4393 domain-containing protein n=3 Tax=Unclassified Bacteria TaxID=49928 RepID=A0AAU6UT29_UNCXX|nr:hypothetical protein [Vibrio metschnikovii]EKO3597506.1 hypothetical protein [Vibrio metschnikovii]EKO3615257.1 hypothetical protein [Vibrio metschnikovii]EKO3622370.1 hypothetical protein [Vibrio metschnikovii]EKO3625536.1 hypothetical protein [Vibrio metschnikovii]